MSEKNPTPATTPTIPEGKISLNAPSPIQGPPTTPEIPSTPKPAETTPESTPTPAPTPEEQTPQDPPAYPAEQVNHEETTEETTEDPTDPQTVEDLQAQLEFFQEVNRVRGIELAVDYGDVAPNSVEGIAIRERAIEQYAIQRFQEQLAAADPRGAAYLLHRQQGGTDEEFFSRKTLTLPDHDLFTESVDLKKQVYKHDLIRKGLSSDKADALVALAVQNNTLDKEAEEAYQAQSKADADELARLAKAAEQEQREWQNKVTEMSGLLNQTITRKDLGVVIPDTEQVAFNQFVRDFIQHDGQDFYIAQKIDPKTLQPVIESLYVQFKKGDLSSIITRKANSLNVKRNQIALGKTKAPVSTPPAPPKEKKLTLGDIKFPGEL